jgi:uncharacterized protein involved in tolerance to divalent cations
MAKNFCQVVISATSRREANKISDVLVSGKLVAGTLTTKGPSKYWWRNMIVEKEYYNVQGFTMLKNKSRIIAAVKKIHKDKCPIIAFTIIEGNLEFLEWIKSSVDI